MKNTLTSWLWALTLAAVMTVPSRAASVTATLDPPQIAMGDSTQLTVTVSGSQEQPATPSVDGLEIQSVRQGTQISIINGSITSSASVTYSITPQREGTFTIPAIHAGDAASQPLTLRVSSGASPVTQTPQPIQGQAASPPGSGPVVMPSQNAAPAPGANPPTGKYGSIEVTLPKKEFYEGELVPVQIKVFIPEDLQTMNIELPQFSSDGFAMDSLGTKPERSEEVIQGRPYAVLIWQSALTAVKTGDYSLNLKMPMTVVVAQQMPQMSDDDSFNSFFRNAFASMGTKKNVVITGNTDSLKILPLPQANRPADFSGAVGQFGVEASASPTKVNAGDPVTLQLKVSGRGNFDRVSTDMLANDSNWKTYSAKSHFDASDSVGYQGLKTFEQPVIPNNGSITEVPSIPFSYFDPEARQYVTRTTAPIAMSVSGSPQAPAPVAPVANSPVASANPPLPASTPTTSGPDLRINRIEPGAFVATLRPVYLNPVFLVGQALPLLALLGGLAFVGHRRRESHPDRARLTAAQQAIRRQVVAMDAAMRDRQAAAFFVHARNALQQRFGQDWKMLPEAITMADVDARFGTGSETIRTVFDMADQASYSDLHFEEADLQQWRQVVVDELKETKR